MEVSADEAPVHPGQPGEAVAEHQQAVKRGFVEPASLAVKDELVVADGDGGEQDGDEDGKQQDLGPGQDRGAGHEDEKRAATGTESKQFTVVLGASNRGLSR